MVKDPKYRLGWVFKGGRGGRWCHATSLRDVRHLPDVWWCGLHHGPSNHRLQTKSPVPHTLTASQVSVTKAGGLSNAPGTERSPNGKMEILWHMCQCTLFDVGGVEIHSIECIEYCTKDQSNVKDVKDTLYRCQCIKGYVCQRCWRCKILWIIDQRLKVHTNMVLLITSLIFNGFLIWKKFWKAET